MIQNIGQNEKTLKSYNAENWAKEMNLKDSSMDPDKVAQDLGSTYATFGEFLASSVLKVNKMQEDADFAMQELATGKSKNIHETMLKVEQADLAFRSLSQIKNKVVDAYREIMRMQV